MWRNWLLRAARLLGNIVGAAVLASLLVSLSHPANGVGPFFADFSKTLNAAVRGDFGQSAVTGLPVTAEIVAVFPFTLQLIGAGALVALLAGVPLGIFLSASRTLRAVAPLMQIVAATPVFVAALALIWFAVRVLQWNEASQTTALSWTMLTHSGDWNAALRGFALPALTVGVAGAVSVQLALRRAVTVAWSAPYRDGLRMMGLGTLDIDLRYAVPDVVAALLRELGDIALALISAAAIAEWVFHRDGAAVLFLKSVAFGDWNTAAAILFAFAALKFGADFVGASASELIVVEEIRR